MDVRRIRDFVAVVRCASFAAASRELRVSQPGLGYQVKQLEDELRVQLLARHARGVALTPAGEAFLRHAQTILAAVNEAKTAMAAISSDSRHEISLGLSPTPAHVLGPLLLDGRHCGPLRLRLQEGGAADLHERLERGSLDAAICLNPGSSLLGATPIYSEPLCLIGAGNSDADVPLAALGSVPLVMGGRSQTPRRALEEAASAAGVKLAIEQEVATSSLQRSLVLRGGCRTVAAYGLFAEEIERGDLCARRIVLPELALAVHAIIAPGISPANRAALLGLLDGIVHELPTPAAEVEYQAAE